MRVKTKMNKGGEGGKASESHKMTHAATSPGVPGLSELIRVVTAHYGVNDTYLINEMRTNHRSMPRHVAMWLAREKMNWPWDKIASEFKRTRATVIRNARRVDELMDDDDDLREIVNNLSKQLFQ